MENTLVYGGLIINNNKINNYKYLNLVVVVCLHCMYMCVLHSFLFLLTLTKNFIQSIYVAKSNIFVNGRMEIMRGLPVRCALNL